MGSWYEYVFYPDPMDTMALYEPNRIRDINRIVETRKINKRKEILNTRRWDVNIIHGNK